MVIQGAVQTPAHRCKLCDSRAAELTACMLSTLQQGRQGGEQAAAGVQAASLGQMTRQRVSSPRSAWALVSMTFSSTQRLPVISKLGMRCPKLSAVRHYETYTCLQLLTVVACCKVPHCCVMAVIIAAVTCSTRADDCPCSAGAALFSAIMGPRRRAKEDQAALDAAAAAAAAATRAAAGAGDCRFRLPCFAPQHIDSCGPSALATGSRHVIWGRWDATSTKPSCMPARVCTCPTAATGLQCCMPAALQQAARL